MDTIDRFTRCRLLFGDNFNKLTSSNILLLGVGGVGSFCLDSLFRTGIQNITIVDFDSFEITNQNRQIGSDALGQLKVKRLKELYPTVTPINAKITSKWIDDYNFSQYDLIIDAIDDMSAKVALCLHVNDHVKYISSMGGAKKLDPTRIKIDSIWKTQGDPLAKKFRYELRKANFAGDFQVVYSDEISNCQGLGSFVGVTGSVGLALSALAIKTLLGK